MTFLGLRYQRPSTRAIVGMWLALALACWAVVSAAMYGLWRLWVFVGVGL